MVYKIRNFYKFINFLKVEIVNKPNKYNLNIQKVLTKSNSSLSNSKIKQHEVETKFRPFGEKIKENVRTLGYTGIIAIGIGVTGTVLFVIFRELFSPKSPNSVYTRTFEKVKNDARVQDALGMPIKSFGEENRRRRRNIVAHKIYNINGVEYMRMQFYIQGIRGKATVHLEVSQNSSGNYDYRYLFVRLDNYSKSTILLEDNRQREEVKN